MPEPAAAPRGYSAEKKQLVNRLRRVEGQVRGVQRMVEQDAWCPDVLNQVAAIRAALDGVALRLAEGHVRHCMADGAGDARRREEMTAELMHALGRLVR